MDVYHTDVHAFDMIKPNDDMSIQAIRVFEVQFEDALQAIKRRL